jgi:putative nucleotidyltransferase with HDIG domain
MSDYDPHHPDSAQEGPGAGAADPLPYRRSAPLEIQSLVYLAQSSQDVFERCTELALQATSATTALASLHRPVAGLLEIVSAAGHLAAEALGRQSQPGEALAWRVFTTQRALLIGNPHEQPDVHFISGRPSAGVYLGVPLVDPDGHTFGVLSVDTSQTGADFGEEDAQALTLLASAAGSAYARLLALEQAQHLTERYALLADLTSELEALTDPFEIRQAAQRAILPLSGLDTVSFYQLEGQVLSFVERTGEVRPALLQAMDEFLTRFQGREMLASDLFLRRDPLLVPDYRAWPHHHEGLWKAGIGSLVVLPVWSGDTCYGFRVLYSLGRLVELSETALRLLGSLAARVARAFERTAALQQLLQTREAALRGLGRVLEYRDSDTAGHTDRVTGLALQLGQALKLSAEQLLYLRWGAYLHDVGKVAIRDEVLRKPGALTPEERREIETHVTVGDELLRGEDFLPGTVRQIVRHHHERWDGQGYPDRLEGTQIPFLARIFSIVDVYDALTSVRPYKAAWTAEAAAQELQRSAGTQFDPQLTLVFIRQVLKR